LTNDINIDTISPNKGVYRVNKNLKKHLVRGASVVAGITLATNIANAQTKQVHRDLSDYFSESEIRNLDPDIKQKLETDNAYFDAFQDGGNYAVEYVFDRMNPIVKFLYDKHPTVPAAIALAFLVTGFALGRAWNNKKHKKDMIASKVLTIDGGKVILNMDELDPLEKKIFEDIAKQSHILISPNTGQVTVVGVKFSFIGNSVHPHIYDSFRKKTAEQRRIDERVKEITGNKR